MAREFATWMRPHLEGLKAKMIDHITGGPSGYHLEVRKTYTTKYQERIDTVLKDFELGIVKGKHLGPPAGANATPAPTANVGGFVAKERLAALRNIQSSAFDLGKLIRLCEELNSAWSQNNCYSIAALLRTLLDHVPPIFSQSNFPAVVAQTSGRSLKAHLDALEKAARNNADLHLHEQIRPRLALPRSTGDRTLTILSARSSDDCCDRGFNSPGLPRRAPTRALLTSRSAVEDARRKPSLRPDAGLNAVVAVRNARH